MTEQYMHRFLWGQHWSCRPESSFHAGICLLFLYSTFFLKLLNHLFENLFHLTEIWNQAAFFIKRHLWLLSLYCWVYKWFGKCANWIVACKQVLMLNFITTVLRLWRQHGERIIYFSEFVLTLLILWPWLKTWLELGVLFLKSQTWIN